MSISIEYIVMKGLGNCDVKKNLQFLKADGAAVVGIDFLKL